MGSEYTPDEFAVRGAYNYAGGASVDSDAVLDAEFDRFIGRVKAEAWDEGAEAAWRETGEGFNGEYAGGYGTHDGAVSFREATDGDVPNPYREEDGQ